MISQRGWACLYSFWKMPHCRQCCIVSNERTQCDSSNYDSRGSSLSHQVIVSKCWHRLKKRAHICSSISHLNDYYCIISMHVIQVVRVCFAHLERWTCANPNTLFKVYYFDRFIQFKEMYLCMNRDWNTHCVISSIVKRLVCCSAVFRVKYLSCSEIRWG